MGIETESEQTYKPILNVGDENIEESEHSEQFLIEASGPGTKAFHRKTMRRLPEHYANIADVLQVKIQLNLIKNRQNNYILNI